MGITIICIQPAPVYLPRLERQYNRWSFTLSLIHIHQQLLCIWPMVEPGIHSSRWSLDTEPTKSQLPRLNLIFSSHPEYESKTMSTSYPITTGCNVYSRHAFPLSCQHAKTMVITSMQKVEGCVTNFRIQRAHDKGWRLCQHRKYVKILLTIKKC